VTPEHELFLGCLGAIVISASLFAGIVLWALKGGGKPIKGLPRAPSYALTCVFGAIWNAFIVRSLPATLFCLALAGLFRLGDGWSYRRQTWTVASVLAALTITLDVWILRSFP
jgi:hypothetical protein